MVIQVGIGLSTQSDPLLAAKEAVVTARLNLRNTEINLALVFSSMGLASDDALKVINSYLPKTQILGCSSLAVISNQGIFKHGLIILLLSLAKEVSFNIAMVKDIKTKSSLAAGEELGEKLLHGFKDIRRDVSILFSDGLLKSTPGLITGLQEILGGSFPVVGASASDNLIFKKTYIYFNQEVSDDAACALLLGGKLNFGLGTKHGWKPLGKPRRITKSQGNIVNEIDGLPAVKIYEDYFAKSAAELKKELKHISILYPIGIYLGGEKEFLLRNVSSIEDDGSVIFQGDVPMNSQIRLMIGTKETALNAVKEAVEEVKKDLSDKPCKFALVFNSASRYRLLGREANKELEIIKAGLGKDTSIIGLYTYGEQAPLKSTNYLGKTHFHNQTITILGIGG